MQYCKNTRSYSVQTILNNDLGVLMSSVRQRNFLSRKEKILAMAESLLLDNNEDITLSELASELDIWTRDRGPFCLWVWRGTGAGAGAC